MEGLFRRGGVWHARLVVPARLRAIAGRREFIKSTGSRVLMTAKVAHAELMALWRRQLLELENCKAVTDDDVRRLLNGSPALEMSEHLSILTAKDVTGIGIEALLTEAEAGRLDLLCRVPDSAARGHELSFDEWVNGKLTPANRVELGMAGRILPIFDLMGDSAATLLASGAPSAYVAAFDLGGSRIFVPDESALVPVERLVLRAVQVSALRRRWLSAVPLERRQTLGGSTGASTRAEQGQGVDWKARPFLEAMETYLTDPSGLPGRTSSPKEINQHRKALERFGEHCGNKPLGQFIDDDLRSFKRWVRTWPSGNLTGDLRRATWRDTVAVAQAAGWPPITAGAAEERLTWVRQFFKWLHQRGRLSVEIGRSLAGEQDLTKAQQKDLARQRGAVQADGEVDDGVTRRPFSSAELALIFGQEQFRTGHGRHKAKGAARCDPHEYWMPLLALLHGLRPGEVCQLSLDCVRQVDGVWCLDVNERDRDRSVKVTKRRKVELGARVVPLHPYAVELGLLKYHAALKATGQYRRLFPDLRWGGTDERYGKESGRKFTNLKNQLGLGREVSRHSFRHTANDVFARVELRGMDAGLQKIVRYEVIGHKVPAEDVNGVHYTHVKVSDKAALVAGAKFELPVIAAFDVSWGVQAVGRALKGQDGREQNGPFDPGE